MFKKIFLTIIIIILSSAPVFAEFNLSKALKAYTHNLDSKTEGVVESSLVFITKLRLSYPEENFDKSLKKIDTMLGENLPPALNYKLFITKMILTSNNPNFALPILPEKIGPTEFFIQISELVFRNTEITRI